MRYTVTRLTMDDEFVEEVGLSKKQAVDAACALSEKYPHHQIYITWYRASDQQHGFLNPSGDHDVTGKPW